MIEGEITTQSERGEQVTVLLSSHFERELQKDFQIKNPEPLRDDSSEVKVTAGLLEKMSNITPIKSTKLVFGFLLKFLDGWFVLVLFKVRNLSF